MYTYLLVVLLSVRQCGLYYLLTYTYLLCNQSKYCNLYLFYSLLLHRSDLPLLKARAGVAGTSLHDHTARPPRGRERKKHRCWGQSRSVGSRSSAATV